MNAIYFCGHKSQYGLAHLNPILKSKFKILSIVLATNKRWGIFQDKIEGKKYYNEQNIIELISSAVKKAVKKTVSENILRYFKKNYTKEIDVVELARKYKVPIWMTNDVNEREFIDKLKKSNVEVIFTAAFPQIYSKEVIGVAKKGIINFHPSLLPKYRGAHPHYWAIVKGESISGITAHFVEEGIDNGDIISKVEIPIAGSGYKDFYKKIVDKTPELVKKVEGALFEIDGPLKRIRQEEKDATFFRQEREIHNKIQWDANSAFDINNLVRGEKAYTFHRHKKIYIIECCIEEKNRNLTNNILVGKGTIIDLDHYGIVVQAKEGIIVIKRIIENKKILEAVDYIKRRKVMIGEKFD